MKVYVCLYYTNASMYLRTEDGLTKESQPVRTRSTVTRPQHRAYVFRDSFRILLL